MVNFGNLLNDLEWVMMPKLSHLHLQVFFLTVDQYIDLYKMIPQCFKNLQSMNLKVLELAPIHGNQIIQTTPIP